MRIQLDVNDDSEYFFSPVYHLDSRLLAMEMQGYVHSVQGVLPMHQALMMGKWSRQQKLALLNEQLSILQDNASWFCHHHVIALLKLDVSLAALLIENAWLESAFRALPFLQIAINEHFPNISSGRDNTQLEKLSQSFHLWLDDFGIGYTNMKPFYDGVFSCVKMDALFIDKLVVRPVSRSIMTPLLQVIKKHCPGLCIVAKGVDDIRRFEQLRHLDIDAVQGNLWPPLLPDVLDNALMPLRCYGE
ncbi:EAL domain-containing protein [Dickeya lacustris]|uniref:EAL domain-containing protein n=1 Tax=Dickeya lacustris TaxID=2259638 RepID=A0ABY8G947_9GAMM|nr:EAL domain-containing protein [Dickeya lacustris]WFN56494.1 EAL domain-containing protein [Dickeya lacustris]